MEQLSQILERLNREQVEYVLVFGLAAVVHGVPLVTRDVDICMPFTKENLTCLEKSLTGLNPIHRETPQRLPFSVAADYPSGLRNTCFRTELGVLDCLGEIKGVGGCEEVSRRTVVAELPIGPCRVLNLAALIEAKEVLDRTQDKPALLHLREIQNKKKPQS